MRLGIDSNQGRMGTRVDIIVPMLGSVPNPADEV
jgi:hypothetical protein